MSQPRIALSIVSHNHARFLSAIINSLKQVTYPRESWKVFLVDNASTDETAKLARQELVDEIRGCLRGSEIAAEFIALPTNTGFAGANNLVMERALAEKYDYVYLLNPDTEVAPNFISEAIRVAEQDSKIGAVQSLLVLAQDRERINSWGNELHFLGFSFCGGYREQLASETAKQKLTVRDIAVASGAAVLLRTSVLRETGLFDETIFAYHEDVDLSLRIQLAGFRVVLAPDSRVYHNYEFSRSIKKFYFMERNRFWVHGKNLRFSTLILLAPAALIMELGLWAYAFYGGWWREKARAYRFYLAYAPWRDFFTKRRTIQSTRKISDRSLVKKFSPVISYQEVTNPMWDQLGNPIFAFYWRIVRFLICW